MSLCVCVCVCVCVLSTTIPTKHLLHLLPSLSPCLQTPSTPSLSALDISSLPDSLPNTQYSLPAPLPALNTPSTALVCLQGAECRFCLTLDNTVQVKNDWHVQCCQCFRCLVHVKLFIFYFIYLFFYIAIHISLFLDHL